MTACLRLDPAPPLGRIVVAAVHGNTAEAGATQVRVGPSLAGRAALLAALLAGLVPGPVWAQSASEKGKVDQEIGATRENIESASVEERRLLGLLEQSADRKAQLDAKLALMDREIGGVQRELDAASSRLSALETEQRLTAGRLQASVGAFTAAKTDLSRQAIASYTGASEAANYAAMFLGSATVGDLASKRSYLRAVVGSQSETIARAEKLRDQVDDLGREVERSRKDAQAQRDVVARQRSSLLASRDAQAAVRAQVQGEITQTESLRVQVVTRKDEFEAQLEGLQRQSTAIAESLRRRAAESTAGPPATAGGAGPAAAPSQGRGRLLLPVRGAPITSPFGPRVHPVYGTVRLHTGIDYGADSGTSIGAANDGVVISSGWLGDYGIATLVDHGGGIVTVYAHQSASVVSAGQRVSAGSTIGRVGSTGASTGPHLHFEVRVNGEPVNPASYL